MGLQARLFLQAFAFVQPGLGPGVVASQARDAGGKEMRRSAVGPDRQAHLDVVVRLLRAIVFQGLRGRLVVGERPVVETKGRGDG